MIDYNELQKYGNIEYPLSSIDDWVKYVDLFRDDIHDSLNYVAQDAYTRIAIPWILIHA